MGLFNFFKGNKKKPDTKDEGLLGNMVRVLDSFEDDSLVGSFYSYLFSKVDLPHLTSDENKNVSMKFYEVSLCKKVDITDKLLVKKPAGMQWRYLDSATIAAENLLYWITEQDNHGDLDCSPNFDVYVNQLLVLNNIIRMIKDMFARMDKSYQDMVEKRIGTLDMLYSTCYCSLHEANGNRMDAIFNLYVSSMNK